MEIMKKFGLFLLAGIVMTLGFVSCNDDEGDYPTNYPLITTVCPLDGGDYCFQRDNGDKLYPSDKTRVPGYRPADDGTKQRAIIWFSLLNETVPGYRYNIALYAVEEIYTGTSEVVEDAARLEELGDARTGYTLGTFNLSREWLTFHALYAAYDNSRHTFTLAVDKSGTTEFENTDENYLNVVVLHDDGGDDADDSGRRLPHAPARRSAVDGEHEFSLFEYDFGVHGEYSRNPETDVRAEAVESEINPRLHGNGRGQQR